jgi:hypothetical protein
MGRQRQIATRMIDRRGNDTECIELPAAFDRLAIAKRKKAPDRSGALVS